MTGPIPPVVHGLIQAARGEITDGDHARAEKVLTQAVEIAKDLEAQRDRLRDAGEALASAVRGLDSYAALGGAPMERTERADAALRAWGDAS